MKVEDDDVRQRRNAFRHLEHEETGPLVGFDCSFYLSKKKDKNTSEHERGGK